MKCKSCGGEKKHHSEDLWTRHQESHAAVLKYQKRVAHTPPHPSWSAADTGAVFKEAGDQIWKSMKRFQGIPDWVEALNTDTGHTEWVKDGL